MKYLKSQSKDFSSPFSMLLVLHEKRHKTSSLVWQRPAFHLCPQLFFSGWLFFVFVFFLTNLKGKRRGESIRKKNKRKMEKRKQGQNKLPSVIKQTRLQPSSVLEIGSLTPNLSSSSSDLNCWGRNMENKRLRQMVGQYLCHPRPGRKLWFGTLLGSCNMMSSVGNIISLFSFFLK